MRVLTNIASVVLGSILLVGTIGIANADKDSSEDSQKISATKNLSEDNYDDNGGGVNNSSPTTSSNGSSSKNKGNGGGVSNPPSTGGTTSTTKNPAADPIQTTKPNCPSIADITLDPVIEGRRAFVRMNCYSCHGMGGHGAGMGPSLVGKANEMDAVTGGEEGGMPSFKKNLCTNDIKNLSAYVASLGTKSEQTFTHWWERGLPTR